MNLTNKVGLTDTQMALLRKLEAINFDIYVTDHTIALRVKDPTEFTEIDIGELETLGRMRYIQAKPFRISIQRMFPHEEVLKLKELLAKEEAEKNVA